MLWLWPQVGRSVLTFLARTQAVETSAERDAEPGKILHEARKGEMAALGEMAAAIAHEVKNALAGIEVMAGLLKRRLSDNPEAQTMLADIIAEAKMANAIVLEVLDFVHGEFVTRNVELNSSFTADLPRVNGDRVQLQQLVLNLVSNACEAMQNHEGARKKLDVSTLHGPNGAVQVIVSDTGPGIATDQAEKVFEPFFTTKDNGLGLGLAICRKIARAHGGSLAAEPHFAERQLP